MAPVTMSDKLVAGPSKPHVYDGRFDIAVVMGQGDVDRTGDPLVLARGVIFMALGFGGRVKGAVAIPDGVASTRPETTGGLRYVPPSRPDEPAALIAGYATTPLTLNTVPELVTAALHLREVLCPTATRPSPTRARR